MKYDFETLTGNPTKLDKSAYHLLCDIRSEIIKYTVCLDINQKILIKKQYEDYCNQLILQTKDINLTKEEWLEEFLDPDYWYYDEMCSMSALLRHYKNVMAIKDISPEMSDALFSKIKNIIIVISEHLANHKKLIF